jgi:hypothetical protein
MWGEVVVVVVVVVVQGGHEASEGGCGRDGSQKKSLQIGVGGKGTSRHLVQTFSEDLYREIPRLEILGLE